MHILAVCISFWYLACHMWRCEFFSTFLWFSGKTYISWLMVRHYSLSTLLTRYTRFKLMVLRVDMSSTGLQLLISHVTSSLGLQWEETPTANPMFITLASHIANTMLTWWPNKSTFFQNWFHCQLLVCEVTQGKWGSSRTNVQKQPRSRVSYLMYDVDTESTVCNEVIKEDLDAEKLCNFMAINQLYSHQQHATNWPKYGSQHCPDQSK